MIKVNEILKNNKTNNKNSSITFMCIIRVVPAQLVTSPVSVTEKAVGRYGWMKSIALAMRPTSVNVIMMTGEHTIAITGKMSRSTAVKVSNFTVTSSSSK